MARLTRDKKENTNLGPEIKRRVSTRKKMANNFKRQRDIMDAFDFDSTGAYRDFKKVKNYKVNYDLLNGRLDTTMYSDPVCFNIGQETVSLEGHTITHYPLISQIASAIIGEIQARPLKPIAIDTGPSGINFREKKINEMLKRLVNEQIVEPTRQLIQQNYLSKNQIQDPFALSIEEQQQIMQEINSQAQKLTPEAITDFITNDLQTPNQKILQQLNDYLFEKLDIKHKIWENGKHAVATGEAIYYVGERHGEPVFEAVNPMYFTASGSQNVEWYQEKSWCRYEQWFSVTDIMLRHAEYFSAADLRQLEKLVEPIGGLEHVGDPMYDKVQERVMYEMSVGGPIAQKHDGINYKTREGSNQFKQLYADVINKYGDQYGHSLWNYGVREAHICWRDKRKMYEVIRIENDRRVRYFRDEHYEPSIKDYEVNEIWVDQVWEGRKVGSVAGKEFYLDIKPIPGQYKSIHNPFGTDLPYYGKPFNTHKNNSKNVSPIDLGKPWQMEFDITMSNIKHDLATDLGKVMILPMMLKPDHWKWQDWMDTIRNGKIAITQLSRNGTNFDPALLRNIDLSKTSNIADKMAFLQSAFQNLVRAMKFNEARIGAVGQYTTNENITQSSAASYNQTEDFFNTHFAIAQKALNALVNRTRILYKNKPQQEYIHDDISRILANLSPDSWFETWGVKLSLSSEDARKVAEVKAQMQAFIQNGMSPEAVLGLSLADTTADVIDVIRVESKKAEKLRQEQQMQQQQMMQQQMQQDAAQKEADRAYKKYEHDTKLASQERRAAEQSTWAQKQADVDNNKIADTIQKAAMEIEAKQKELIEKMKIEREKLRLDEKELELKYGSGNNKDNKSR